MKCKVPEIFEVHHVGGGSPFLGLPGFLGRAWGYALYQAIKSRETLKRVPSPILKPLS